MDCCGGSILLAGTVAGVDACSLASNADTIVVGSALDCDLTVTDPLVPPRAFRLRHIKQHTGAAEHCASHWLIEACRGARVYVNGDLTTKDRLRFGDRLAVGCHHFVFERDTRAERITRTNTNIQDLCSRLMAATEVPLAFLRNCPDYLSRARIRKAVQWGTLLLLVLGVLFTLHPPMPTFMNVQPPMEIVMVAEVTMAPSPKAVKGLEEVERKEIQPPATDVEQPEMAKQDTPTIEPEKTEFASPDAMTAAPLETPAQTPAPALNAGPSLAPLVVSAPVRQRLELARSAPEIAQNLPRRRLTMEEAANPVVRQELGNLNVRIRSAPALEAGFKTRSNVIQETALKPTETVAAPSVQKGLDLMVANQPSPLKFETYKGARIPVARVPESLTPLAVQADEPGVQFDGKVSDSEIAVSWKSGQFRIHGPNPQPAQPPTYCYVGKTTKDGKDFLYVSFVCEDPNVAALVSGTGAVWKDDSVEIFLDTNADRRDYHQLIVNCRGQYIGYYCPNGDMGINGKGSAWNAQPEIKTIVNPEAKRWTGEILIPFSTLGGTPAQGSRWAVNFTRAFRGQGQRPDSVYQNWFLVYNGREPNYHNPELFGIFQW